MAKSPILHIIHFCRQRSPASILYVTPSSLHHLLPLPHHLRLFLSHDPSLYLSLSPHGRRGHPRSEEKTLHRRPCDVLAHSERVEVVWQSSTVAEDQRWTSVKARVRPVLHSIKTTVFGHCWLLLRSLASSIRSQDRNGGLRLWREWPNFKTSFLRWIVKTLTMDLSQTRPYFQVTTSNC